MHEELINQIVQRILSEPTFQALMQGNNAGRVEEPKAAKPDGLVLLNFVPEFERVITALKQQFGREYTLNILPSDQVFVAKPNLLEGMNWITPQDALSKLDWQTIILPACSHNTLAKVALGIRDNPLSEMIGRGITQGVPTLLVTKYLKLTAQTPIAYHELYEGYLQTVRSYGVLVCATLDEAHALLKHKRTPLVSQGPAVRKSAQTHQDSLYEQRLVTREQDEPQNVSSHEVIRYELKYLADKDALGIAEEAIVLVKRGTVISPLARDTLKSRRIELRQEMEGGRP